MRSELFFAGLATALFSVTGCGEPEAPINEARVYSLIAIDGAALPTRGMASGSLAMSADNLFILSRRDTAGATSLDIGTVHWAGPFEFETGRVHLVFLPDTGTTWQATLFNMGDSLALTRVDQIESYRRR